jgi:RNA polymerase sigma factor (sigma-70 family)
MDHKDPTTWMSQPDSDLVRSCAQGDAAAWEALVRRYKNIVYAIPARAGLEPETVEDVFQGTFARLVERIHSVRDGTRVRAWLVTTARRLTIDAIRARRSARIAPVPHEDLSRFADAGALPLEALEKRQEHVILGQAWRRLDPSSRKLLSLLFHPEADGPPSYQRISREMGIPVGSIGPTRARSLRKLRIEYDAIVRTPSPAGCAS